MCFICAVNMVRTDPAKSWNVTEFKIQIFQAWKVVELGLGPGKSWKINQMVAAFLPHFGLDIPYHCLLSDSVQSVVCVN